jgi:hypothetical protein
VQIRSDTHFTVTKVTYLPKSVTADTSFAAFAGLGANLVGPRATLLFALLQLKATLPETELRKLAHVDDSCATPPSLYSSAASSYSCFVLVFLRLLLHFPLLLLLFLRELRRSALTKCWAGTLESR